MNRLIAQHFFWFLFTETDWPDENESEDLYERRFLTNFKSYWFEYSEINYHDWVRYYLGQVKLFQEDLN